jgi:hypothetical protein
MHDGQRYSKEKIINNGEGIGNYFHYFIEELPDFLLAVIFIFN